MTWRLRRGASERLVNCLRIFEGRCFHLWRRSQLTVSQNAFMEAVPKINLWRWASEIRPFLKAGLLRGPPL